MTRTSGDRGSRRPTPLAGEALARRVGRLVDVYRDIGRVRMAGVPVLHPALAVEAVDFEPVDDGATGVLVTPWFMNLVWLPGGDGDGGGKWPVGVRRGRVVGETLLEFFGANEPGVGPHAGCSLFSPMFEFVDQAAACATARAVLSQLRVVAPSATSSPPVLQDDADPATGSTVSRSRAAPTAGRRAFLFGRRDPAGPGVGA